MLAQTAALVGTVADPKKNGIPGASVIVQRIGDSTWLSALATDVNGTFQMKGLPQKDSLLLSVRFLGFNEYSAWLFINKAALKLDTIFLKENTTQLESVVVTAPSEPVIVKKDTVEYSMNSFASRPTENIQDAIRKMPGLDFDNTGALLYNGQRVAKILVNGREYFGTDGAIALSSLPADVVQKLQLIDAKKDAKNTETGGKETEKILNIQIKADARKFGNLVGGGGTDQRYELKGMANRFKTDQNIAILALANNINVVNYNNGNDAIKFINSGNGITETITAGTNFQKKINGNVEVNSSYNYTHPNSYRESRKDRMQFIVPDSSFFTDGSTNARNISNAHRLNASVRIKTDSLSTLHVEIPGLQVGSAQGETNTETTTSDESRKPVNKLSSRYQSSSETSSIPININWSKRFSDKRKNLLISLSTVATHQSSNDLNLATTTFYRNATDSLVQLRQQIIQTGSGIQMGGRVQYLFPLAGKFSGVANNYFSYSKNENTKETWALDAGNERLNLDTLYSNIFRSLTITNSGNVALQYRDKKWDASGGVTINSNYLRQSNQSNDPLKEQDIAQTFTNFSPLVRVGYTADITRRLVFNFSAHTSPPSMTQLQPVPNNTNPLYIQVGNPNLKSTFSQVYGLEFQRNSENDKLFSYNLNYAPVNNRIISTIQYGSHGEQISSYTNVDGVMSMAANIGYGIAKKADHTRFGIKLNGGISYSKDKNFVNGIIATSQQWGINPSATANFNNSLLDIILAYRPAMSVVQYDQTPSQNQNFVNHRVSLSADLNIKKTFMFRNNLSYSFNNSLPDGFSKTSMLWNAAISYLFTKNKRTELSLSAYDILKQNRNISRQADQNYIESTESNNLQTFLLVTMSYHFR